LKTKEARGHIFDNILKQKEGPEASEVASATLRDGKYREPRAGSK